jgi:enhancing lycopene biosynthesis protein 2
MAKTPRKIGIIISGGAPWEIIFCSFFIEKNGYQVQPLTIYNEYPDQDISDAEADLSRNKPEFIGNLKATDMDALIIPGGMKLFNAMCDFEESGDIIKIDDNIRSLIRGLFRLEKPVGAFGAAALLITRSINDIAETGMIVTVGNNPKLQAGIDSTGAQAVATRPGEVVLDEDNKIVTSGGELSTKRPIEVSSACENLLSGLIEFMKRRK